MIQRNEIDELIKENNKHLKDSQFIDIKFCINREVTVRENEDHKLIVQVTKKSVNDILLLESYKIKKNSKSIDIR